MKAVVQRVKKASVSVGGKLICQIKTGFLILLGISQEDGEAEVDSLVKKIASLRVFNDRNQKMNLSIKDVSGQALVVSQFTLYGDTSKGNRPSFIKAAKPKKAEGLYNLFIDKLKSFQIKTKQGMFKAMMDVELINDGPVTIVLET
jgi:D-aminoacyl-tRNA deacylase